MYRQALSLRKDLGLADGSYAIVPEFSDRAIVAQITTDDRTIMCVTTFDEPIELEGRWEILICSRPTGISDLEISLTKCAIPTNTTVWLKRP
ncbi:MAG: hypothetical protein Q4P05_08585, partial [Actinomycetaceae bacterium]|nr:hypothetical protein [Actinomycetaceae bacterium]